MHLQRFLDLSQSENPNAKISITKTFSGFDQAIRGAFQGKGYYDTLHFGDVPNGALIRSNLIYDLTQEGYEGYVIHMPNSNDPAKNNGIMIDLKSSKGDSYRIGLMGFDGVPTENLPDPRFAQTASVFKDIGDEIPLFKAEYNHKPIGTYGRPIKEEDNDPILEVKSSPGKTIEIVLQLFTALKGKDGERASPLDNPFILTDLELIDPSDGKLISPK